MRFKIEVEERGGFWGPVYWARIRVWHEDNSMWWNCGSEKARTPQKAEARARERVKEILAERKRKAEAEYTVEFEID